MWLTVAKSCEQYDFEKALEKGSMSKLSLNWRFTYITIYNISEQN